MLLRVSMLVAGLGVFGGCSSDDADPGDTEGSGGSTTTADLFPNAPECREGFVSVLGTLAGEPYQGGSLPTDWSALDITFGVGEIVGGSFGNEYEIEFAEKLSLGKKVPVTGGYLYVMSNHSLMHQYLCLQAGEIGLIEAPPSAENVLIEFSLTAGAMGRNCEGAAVDMTLNGCISRTSSYVP
jgi:hypothetical protein